MPCLRRSSDSPHLSVEWGGPLSPAAQLWARMGRRKDRTRRSARVMAMQHGHGHVSGAAACGIMPPLCGDSSVQRFAGADRSGVMWSTLRSAIDAILAFSVLVPLVEPPHTSHEYEQPQMLVSRYGPGSSQDRCHLQHSCGHEWDEGAASGRRNAPSISQDRTRRSAHFKFP